MSFQRDGAYYVLTLEIMSSKIPLVRRRNNLHLIIQVSLRHGCGKSRAGMLSTVSLRHGCGKSRAGHAFPQSHRDVDVVKEEQDMIFHSECLCFRFVNWENLQITC
ncbi:hypothetical protein CEXT_781811 [Caerostris extrusa]|uniref:Uncharacterized protein n=1 Tax=Caerostris extrusa TaxID=172846 RepID=A0AAV4R8N3_CAEEX|nr:hypothetical protein CEXT_781811 [Caerostris extrusa]